MRLAVAQTGGDAPLTTGLSTDSVALNDTTPEAAAEIASPPARPPAAPICG